MAVLFPPGLGAAGGRCRLDDDEAHHLRVRRAEPGEVVAVRDGAGSVGTGRLRRDRQEWEVEIESLELSPRPASLVLAVGAGDRDRFAWLVEKASELGVTTIIPLETERTAGVATRLRARYAEKLRRQALEVIKQSGAAWATAVEDLMSLDRFLESPASGQGWLADPEGGPPPGRQAGDPVTVVVGPEGGLTASERDAVISAGYRPTRLAAHTLRFETAAIAAAAAVNAARLRGANG